MVSPGAEPSLLLSLRTPLIIETRLWYCVAAVNIWNNLRIGLISSQLRLRTSLHIVPPATQHSHLVSFFRLVTVHNSGASDSLLHWTRHANYFAGNKLTWPIDWSIDWSIHDIVVSLTQSTAAGVRGLAATSAQQLRAQDFEDTGRTSAVAPTLDRCSEERRAAAARGKWSHAITTNSVQKEVGLQTCNVKLWLLNSHQQQ